MWKSPIFGEKAIKYLLEPKIFKKISILSYS